MGIEPTAVMSTHPVSTTQDCLLPICSEEYTTLMIYYKAISHHNTVPVQSVLLTIYLESQDLPL